MKRSPIKPRRKTLRRGEPSSEEKAAAREFCFGRAHGRCEIPFPHKCPVYAPLHGPDGIRGELAHLKAKRRFGWFESDETGQRHLWACNEGHRLQHAYGWLGVKPCPSKGQSSVATANGGDL